MCFNLERMLDLTLVAVAAFRLQSTSQVTNIIAGYTQRHFVRVCVLEDTSIKSIVCNAVTWEGKKIFFAHKVLALSICIESSSRTEKHGENMFI